MYAIEINSLSKRYGSFLAVDSLSLNVKRGELLSLLGVNGAGKSTTIKMLSCLCAPTAGDALVCGHSILTGADEVRKAIAVSPQESAVAPGLTVRENLELICGVHGIGKSETKQRLEELSNMLGLSQVLPRKAGKLSGGWQRRLSIAMALVSRPQVLFLDEPTLGLDVLVKSELWDIIRGLKGKATIVLTTHNMDEADKLSDSVAIMDKGRMLTVGTPEEIKISVGAQNFEDAFVRIVKGENK